MENKPIKRNANILPLSKDHHFGLMFCWKIRQGIKNGAETERMRKYVLYFWEHDMKLHFREEEDIVFNVVQDQKILRALDEHRKIKEQVEKLSTVLPTEEASRQLLDLADMVDN